MATGSVLPRWARLGVIGVVAAAAVQGGGLAPRVHGQTQPTRMSTNLWSAVQGPVISLEFPGGTMREYVAAVQRAAGKETVNVLLPAEAADLPLPPISMKEVTARTALEALQWAFPVMGPSRVEITPIGAPEAGAPTFAIAYRRDQTFVPGPGGTSVPMNAAGGVEVFSIRELVDPAEGEAEAIPVETLLTSIEAALSVGNLGTEPELRFHEESGLLILRGAPNHIMTVRSLLKAIREDAERRRSVARERARRSAEERFNEKRLDIEIALQEKEVQAAKDRLAFVRESEIKGAVGAHEVREAALEAARQEARMRLLMLERERPTAGRSARGADAGDLGDLAQIIQVLQARVTALEAELAKSKDGERKPQ